MTWLKWWFVEVPEWGWRLIGPHWKSIGGLVLLALMALAYVVTTLGAIAYICRVLAWLGRHIGRGAAEGARRSRAKDDGQP